MAFPNGIYAPPGVYTETNFENPTQALLQGLRLPIYIGTGSEILTQNDLEVIRGSSASVDQRVVQEDETGRAVVNVTQTGQVVLGNFDGLRDRIQVKNFPIVDGQGAGRTATNTSSVSVTIDGKPIVVLSIDGSKGVLKLSTPPKAGEEVRVTYYFKRTDTLITDTLSDQVSEDAAILYGAIGQTYEILAGVNDTLVLTVDDDTSEYTVTLAPSNPGSPWTAAQIAAFINTGTAGSSLTASTFTNNFGQTAILLTADQDILIGSGSSNSTLGFTAGQFTSRRRIFYTFQGPIVDGQNGGVTTTDPADVTVKVDGVQIIPTAVDGQTRAVTLPFAPASGSVVTVQYFFNAWQDTFDYLQHINVTSVDRCGSTPDRRDFIEGADFVLKNDRILWGTATVTESGEYTAGTQFFDDTQISTTLVDVRQYLAPCAAVTDTSVSPPVTSKVEFQLPLVPTSGNGRSTPLGSSTFSAVTNGRVDLPTNRPDLVIAYWGFGVQDAVERGPVAVLSVESDTATITLQDPVPVGAEVFATFYYNTLGDQEYTFKVEAPGASGVGTYSITDEAGLNVLSALFGSKSAGLTGITIQFPSGSERTPDVRFESPFSTTSFEGAVEEDVSVTFASKDSTLAKFSVTGPQPYFPIENASDRIRILVDGADLASGSVGLDLGNLYGTSTGVLGFHASMVGDEVAYDADSGFTTYDITAANNGVNLTVDGVLIEALAEIGTGVALDAYVDGLNRAATGEGGTATAGAPTTVTLAAGSSAIDDLYAGWTIRIVSGTGLGQTNTIASYDGGTLVATVDTAWATDPDATSVYVLYKEDHLPQYVSAARFTSAVTITAGEYDALALHYTGDVSGASGTLTATIAAGTYNSSSLLAAALQTALDTAIGAGTFQVQVFANAESQLVFQLIKDPTDAASVLEFLDGALAAVDFATLAGIDTSSATGEGQTKLIDGPIARRYSVAGDNTSALLNDRIIIRNRLVPGSQSVAPQHVIDQAFVRVEGSSGDTETGLSVTEVRNAAWKATVLPATLLGLVGFTTGQVPAATYGDSRDGQPIVQFFAAGGTSTQNNVFKFTLDGTPVTVEFTDAAGTAIPTAGSADVPLGPAATANTVLNQIAAAMATAGFGASAAAVIAAGYVQQEGAGIRLNSALSSTNSGITIGTGSANSDLGFVDADVADRTTASAEALAAALMGDVAASISASLLTWGSPAATHFAAEAIADVVQDAAGASYLFVQSAPGAPAGLGVSSSISWANASSASVLLPGVGLGVVATEGSSGEAGISGFYVTSSDTVNGSGTLNDSLLNSGTGQDGTIGQTYRDEITGLTFTVLEREGGTNYPDGGSFTFTVRKNVTTDSNLPIRTIPGLEVVVSNTLGIGAGDTAIVSTFERGGNEPAVGDSYFVTYNYTKQDFSTKLFTKFAAIEAEYGRNSSENPVTLASYLAILNGAVLVGIQQVQKDLDENNDGVADAASVDAFITALDGLQGSLPGGILPNILVPLDVPTADTVTFFNYLALHCDVQSLIRNRAERTAIVGVPAGTQPRTAGDIAEAIQRARLRLVYPDIATLTLDNADATYETFTLSGPYLASALSGVLVTPSVDVATPWTSRRVFGFDGLARTLDAPTQNQVAVRGVTILEDRPGNIRVRQGFTTDMTQLLTKLPTITQIADEVQQQARATLDRFVGIKFLPGILGQIEGQLATTLGLLVKADILTTYTGIKANVAPDDPTVATVEAFYQPVFPLLYIVIQFNLRSTL